VSIEEQPGTVIVTDAGAGRYTQRITAGRHVLLADEPVTVGGDDAGPNPYDLLLASLGTCTAMTLRMYADRKQIPLERTTVRLRHDRIHAQDCEDCETEKGVISEITREIQLDGELSGEQRARLLEIADRCPVHRTLTAEIKIRTRVAEIRP
jgi:putative redox protein